jgi:stage II sporulation protein AA (anti-sigma F factor antagonist)
MTGIVWQGPQHARLTPWAGRKARGYGQVRGLRVDVRPGDHLLVAVGGEIDRYSGAALRDELLQVLRRIEPRLILDLHEVTFMDAAGIEVLLATRRRAQLEGGWVRVARASPCARRMITLAGLQRELALAKES